MYTCMYSEGMTNTERHIQAGFTAAEAAQIEGCIATHEHLVRAALARGDHAAAKQYADFGEAAAQSLLTRLIRARG